MACYLAREWCRVCEKVESGDHTKERERETVVFREGQKKHLLSPFHLGRLNSLAIRYLHVAFGLLSACFRLLSADNCLPLKTSYLEARD